MNLVELFEHSDAIATAGLGKIQRLIGALEGSVDRLGRFVVAASLNSCTDKSLSRSVVVRMLPDGLQLDSVGRAELLADVAGYFTS